MLDEDADFFAMVMLGRRPLVLEEYECELIARRLSPVTVACFITGKEAADLTPADLKLGRPRSSSTARRHSEIARAYCWLKAERKAEGLQPKHKEELQPEIARRYGISLRQVDTILGELGPARRQQLQAEMEAAVAQARAAGWMRSCAMVRVSDGQLARLRIVGWRDPEPPPKARRRRT